MCSADRLVVRDGLDENEGVFAGESLPDARGEVLRGDRRRPAAAPARPTPPAGASWIAVFSARRAATTPSAARPLSRMKALIWASATRLSPPLRTGARARATAAAGPSAGPSRCSRSRASAAGRLTAGIHGTSESATRMTSASASSGFCVAGVPVVAVVHRMAVGEVDVVRGRFDDRDGQRVGQLDQLVHGRGVAAEVGGDHQGLAGPGPGPWRSRRLPPGRAPPGATGVYRPGSSGVAARSAPSMTSRGPTR